MYARTELEPSLRKAGWKMKLKRQAAAYRRNKLLILMFLPGFALFLLFAYVPLYGILLAFKNYQILEGIWNSPWAGFEHFQRLFAGKDFIGALQNTVVIALLKLVFIFPAPIVLALLLNELRLVWFRRTIQTIVYLPHFFSWVILSGILFTFLGADGGFNKMMALIGLPQNLWLLDPHYFYGILVSTDIWQSVGWGSIIYIAALSSVDPTLYEAAIADGANRWKRVWHISLPSIVPTVVMMFLLGIGHFLAVGFDQIYNLMTPPTAEVGEILDTYVVRRLLTLDYELGTAASLFNSVIGLALVFICNTLVQRLDRDQGLW